MHSAFMGLKRENSLLTVNQPVIMKSSVTSRASSTRKRVVRTFTYIEEYLSKFKMTLNNTSSFIECEEVLSLLCRNCSQ